MWHRGAQQRLTTLINHDRSTLMANYSAWHLQWLQQVFTHNARCLLVPDTPGAPPAGYTHQSALWWPAGNPHPTSSYECRMIVIPSIPTHPNHPSHPSQPSIIFIITISNNKANNEKVITNINHYHFYIISFTIIVIILIINLIIIILGFSLLFTWLLITFFYY